jgi:hypothetical protein
MKESTYSVWVKVPEADKDGEASWIVLPDEATDIAAFDSEDDAVAERIKLNESARNRVEFRK